MFKYLKFSLAPITLIISIYFAYIGGEYIWYFFLIFTALIMFGDIFFGYDVVDNIKLKTFEGEFEKIKEDKINNATKSKNIKQITNIKNDKIKKSLLELNKIFKSR